jgi:hypothetical protein
MSRFNRLPILGMVILVAAASSALAQDQYIGYTYPADLLGSMYLLAGIDATAKLPHPLGFEAHVLDAEKEGMKSTGLLEEIM